VYLSLTYSLLSKSSSTYAAVAQPSTLGSRIKHLEEMKRSSLRGSADVDPGDALMEVNNVVKDHLEDLLDIQKHLHIGDKDRAGLAVKSMIGDDDSFKDLKGFKDIGFPESYDEQPLALSDVPNDKIAKFIPVESIDTLVEHAQGKLIS
jgi:hypothetical protein